MVASDHESGAGAGNTETQASNSDLSTTPTATLAPTETIITIPSIRLETSPTVTVISTATTAPSIHTNTPPSTVSVNVDEQSTNAFRGIPDINYLSERVLSTIRSRREGASHNNPDLQFSATRSRPFITSRIRGDYSPMICKLVTIRTLTMIVSSAFILITLFDVLSRHAKCGQPQPDILADIYGTDNTTSTRIRSRPGCKMVAGQRESLISTLELADIFYTIAGVMAYTGAQKAIANWLLPLLVLVTIRTIKFTVEVAIAITKIFSATFGTCLSANCRQQGDELYDLASSLFKMLGLVYILYIIWMCYRHLRYVELRERIDALRGARGGFLSDFLDRLEGAERGEDPTLPPQEADQEPPKYDELVKSEDLELQDTESLPGYAEAVIPANQTTVIDDESAPKP